MEPPPAAPSLALPDEQRAALARSALLFCAGSSHRTLEFAAKRMHDLFAVEIDPEAFRAAQLQMMEEATRTISSLLRPAARRP